MASRSSRESVAFVVLTLAVSTIFYLALARLGSLESPGAVWLIFGLMWTPGLVALALQFWFRRTLRGLGWGLGGGRWWALAYLAPIVYAGVTYALIWVTPASDVQAGIFGRLVAKWHFIPLFALGEEIGWRGFLVPRLGERFGLDGTALVSGAVWAVWHWPLILFAGYSGGAPSAYSLACFTVMVLGISYLFAWITLSSGSVWPAMLLHASHNQWIQGFFDQATVDTGPTEWWTGEFGAGLAVAGVVVAFVVRTLPRSSERWRDSSSAKG